MSSLLSLMRSLYLLIVLYLVFLSNVNSTVMLSADELKSGGDSVVNSAQEIPAQLQTKRVSRYLHSPHSHSYYPTYWKYQWNYLGNYLNNLRHFHTNNNNNFRRRFTQAHRQPPRVSNRHRYSHADDYHGYAAVLG